ncbi:DUF6012 family protein, partial [Escherichia coli]|uniref:DUF6012 family protein n=1 Tax=Escherichia coli TaxID=562 RepID=UPI0021BE6D6E
MMYLHLVPRILHHMKNKCTLMSVSVPELSLELKADSLVAMKPYPNKTYHVGMLKGRRALNGFLVKSPRTLAEFTMITLWEIDGFGEISHTVKTLVQDNDYDLVSHDVLLAHAYHQTEEGCQRQDYWPFFAIFNVRYWSLMLSAFRHFIITDWRGVF